MGPYDQRMNYQRGNGDEQMRYNGPAYAALKREYDGGGRLAGLYEKCVRGQ